MNIIYRTTTSKKERVLFAEESRFTLAVEKHGTNKKGEPTITYDDKKFYQTLTQALKRLATLVAVDEATSLKEFIDIYDYASERITNAIGGR